jgi:hypothetical protein
MNLTEAIRELRELRHDYGYASSSAASARARALDLAIAILSEQATVAPARKTDPATSHRAAPEEIKAGSAREKILLTASRLTKEGYPSLTARELALEAGLSHQRAPWKRVSELAKAGFLKPVGVAVDPVSGHQATTYAVSVKGRAAAKEIRERR